MTRELENICDKVENFLIARTRRACYITRGRWRRVRMFEFDVDTRASAEALARALDGVGFVVADGDRKRIRLFLNERG